MASTSSPITPRQRLFGDRVRTRRSDLGITQEQLAHLANIDRTYVASVETGRRNVSLDLIGVFAVALGCDAADLVQGTQSRPGRPRPSRTA